MSVSLSLSQATVHYPSAVPVCRHTFTNRSFSRRRLNHVTYFIARQTASIRKLPVLTLRERGRGCKEGLLMSEIIPCNQILQPYPLSSFLLFTVKIY